jgi:hypothetical protein
MQQTVSAIAKCIDGIIVPALLSASEPPACYVPSHMSLTEDSSQPLLLTLFQQCDQCLRSRQPWCLQRQQQQQPDQTLYQQLDSRKNKHLQHLLLKHQHDQQRNRQRLRHLQTRIRMMEKTNQLVTRHKKESNSEIRSIKVSAIFTER